jgi:hypothetical protein
MAHFAEINSNNEVIKVIKVGDDIFTEARPEYSTASEEYIITFCPLSENGVRWVQTSINTYGGQHTQGGTPRRKNFAGIGGTYDPTADAFIDEKPYPSWTLNNTTYLWDAPTAEPEDDNYSIGWNEDLQVWQGLKYLENPVDENDVQEVDHWNPNTNSWDSYGTFTAVSDTITPN